MLTPLPSSPNGEITHGTHREKTNEIISRTNEIQVNLDQVADSSATFFQISNETEITIPANTPTRVSPSLVTAKIHPDDLVADFLIIDNVNKSFSFKKDGAAKNLIAFEMYIHVVGSGQWGSSSFVTFNREGDSNPITAGASTSGASLIMNASTDSYFLDFYDENNTLVDLRDDNFYFEISSDAAKTIPVKGMKVRIRLYLDNEITWSDE